jgi:hypothetical protein
MNMNRNRPSNSKFLQQHECPQAQGFPFSRAAPAKDFCKLLERGVAALDFDCSRRLLSGPAEFA